MIRVETEGIPEASESLQVGHFTQPGRVAEVGEVFPVKGNGVLSGSHDGFKSRHKVLGKPFQTENIVLGTLHLPAKDYSSAFLVTKGGHLTNGVSVLTVTLGQEWASLRSSRPPGFHLADGHGRREHRLWSW